MMPCIRFCLVKICLFAALLCSTASLAVTYQARMDVAEWQSDASILHCSLTQPIPYLGKVVFEQLAGHNLRFSLHSDSSPLNAGQASLHAEAPNWRPDGAHRELAPVIVHNSSKPLELEETLSTRLLMALFDGNTPRIRRNAWYDQEELVEVGISPVNFRAAYEHFQLCQAALLPVSEEEISRSRVEFDVDRYNLSDPSILRLNLLLEYLAVKGDEIGRIFIDGHTDDTHSASYNVGLSKRRAEAVKNYLTAKGVAGQKIVLRYHGERYPVKDNTTAEGRAYNRRATVRLEKIGLDLLAEK